MQWRTSRPAATLVSRKRNVYKSFGKLCNDIAGCAQINNAILDWLNGKDLRTTTLIERKRILRSVVPVSSSWLLYADHVDHNGSDLYRLACDNDLEGVVGKRKDGLYTPEETTWVKIKNPQYSRLEGRRELFEKKKSAVA